MEIYQVLEYSNLFEDRNVTVPSLLQDIPSVTMLEVVAHYNGQFHIFERDVKKQLSFLTQWSARFPDELQMQIAEYVKGVSRSNSFVMFINNTSSYILMEYILANFNSLPPAESLLPEQELALFKAYILCTEEWTSAQEVALDKFKGNTVKSALDFLKIYLPAILPYFDNQGFHDFRIQAIKAKYFFEFCSGDAVFSSYLELFLKEYNLSSWKEYLMHILTFYISPLAKEPIPTIAIVPSEEKIAIKFLEPFLIDITNYRQDADFLQLRTTPVFRFDNDKFMFLSFNFFVDKIFHSVQFDFSRVLIKNKATFAGKVIKDYPHFKSIYGGRFSETELFYRTMNYVFEKNKYILISGSVLQGTLKDGEPDFYIRDKGKVYFFEYKDVVLNAKTKFSYDYQTIVDEFNKKFVQNQTGDAKGITQLATIIKKYRNGAFQCVDPHDYTKTFVYPVVVYTDHSFDMHGFNYILKQEMRAYLENQEMSNDLNVKDVILLSLDSLIKFQDLFRHKILKINNCFNEYYSNAIKGKTEEERLSSFDTFMHQKTLNMTYTSPQMLFENVEEWILSMGNK